MTTTTTPHPRRLRSARGQGTVEYVALILLVAGVLSAVVAWGNTSDGKAIGERVTDQLERSIGEVGKPRQDRPGG